MKREIGVDTYISDTWLAQERPGDRRIVWRSEEHSFERNGRRIPRAVPAVKTCRTRAPAKYRRLGATTKNDYAFPECWMYPVRFRSEKETVKHIRAAASRFAKHGHRYPKWVQQKIARRLDAAKRRYGIGEYRQRRRTSKVTRMRRAA